MRALRTIICSISPRNILWALIVIFASYFTFLAFERHDNFYSLRLDLGNMEQTVWNLTHGNGFTMTDPFGTGQISRLAAHADFLLILLSPFYTLWSDPKMLILIQTIVICLGALPLYWIAWDTLKSERIAVLFSLAYLLYPSLERMMLHDFHAVALSMTFLLFSYWFMIQKRYVLFTICAVLAGLGKEHIWFAIGLMGLYMTIRQKSFWFGIAVSIASFGIFCYLFWYAIPAVAINKQHFALQYLSDFGDNQNGIIVNLLRHPRAIIMTLFKPDRLYYYYQLLLPVGFLPLLSPVALIFAALSLFINVISNNAFMRQIDYQYTSDIIPFLFISAIDGYKKLQIIVERTKKSTRPKIWQRAGIGIVILIVFSSYLWGELPFERESRFFYFIHTLPERDVMRQVAQKVSPVYTVSVSNNIGSHFSAREYLYNFPVNAMSADYAIVSLGDRNAWPSVEEQERTVDELLASDSHILIEQKGNFYAFQKK